MKYSGYGTFLGLILASIVLLYYSLFHNLRFSLLLPYIFVGSIVYFFLIGYYICHKDCSFKAGLRAGLTTGIIAALYLSVACIVAHQGLFFEETIGEPDKLAGFKDSGLLSIRRFIVYYDIRMSIIYMILGTVLSGFAAGMGSYTAANIRRSEACRVKPVMPT